MTRINLKTVLTALVLALGWAPGLGTAETGRPAPDFSVRAADGTLVSLKDLKGKLVVLEWVNEGCPFVGKHYGSGNLQALQGKYTEKGVVWLSVCSSAKGRQGYWRDGAEALAFKKKQKAAMTHLLLDPDGALGHAYGAKTTPHLFVVDKAGRLAYQGAIDDTPSTRQKDVKTARNWVAQALDELLAGKPVSVPETRSYGCSVKYAD
jgi:peroxiredoxin